MRHFLPSLFCAVFLLCIPVFAAPLLDDFSSVQGGDWCSYGNLAALSSNISTELEWKTAPDFSARSVLNHQVPATALYAVNGADSIFVSIYSTFCTLATEYKGVYRLGYDPFSSPANFYRTSLCSRDGRVYLSGADSRLLSLCQTAYGEYLFVPAASSDSLVDYGLSIFCSSDRSTFTKAALTLTGIRSALAENAAATCYHESYSCAIPAGTQYIRLELREMSTIALEDGGSFPHRTSGSLRFARVQFQGDALAVGSLVTPPPVPSAPDPDLQRPAHNPSQASSTPVKPPPESRPAHGQASSRASGKTTSKSASDNPKAESDTASTIPEQEPAAPPPAANPQKPQNKTALLGGVYLVAALFVLAAVARKR